MDIKKTLELQKLLCRTKRGRKIGDKAIPLVEDTMVNSELKIDQMTECLNCQLILNSDHFSNGCPNCGVKDTKIISDLTKKIVEKKI